MRNFSKILIFSLFIGIFGIGVATPALAATPILSATYQGAGLNNVQIGINNADPFDQITLDYRQSSSLWTVVNNIGSTDNNGNFNQSISLPSDGSGSPVQIYVVVDSQQSATVQIYPNGSNSGNCGYYGCSVGGMTLSQTSLNVNVGQSATVTASYPYLTNGGISVYVSSNSNSSVASATASGNQVTVYGNSAGSTTFSICASGSGSCVSLYVTVSGGSCSYYGCGVGGLTLSQTSLNVNVGQSATVTASYPYYSYSNSFYISSNSNSSVASAVVSGNQVTVYGNSAGSTTFSICATGSSGVCVSLYVTVGGNNCYYNGSSYYNNCGTLSLSQTSLSMSAGQNSYVSITSGNYY